MANSNIYLNLPDNIKPGSSSANSYLLEKKVATLSNIGISNTYITIYPNRFFKLSDLGINTKNTDYFINTKNLNDGTEGTIYGGI